MEACLFTKIVNLLSRISSKIDLCGATGHDQGDGSRLAAAVGSEAVSKVEAAAAGWQRHQQWCWRKHLDGNDGDNLQQRLQQGPGIAG